MFLPCTSWWQWGGDSCRRRTGGKWWCGVCRALWAAGTYNKQNKIINLLRLFRRYLTNITEKYTASSIFTYFLLFFSHVSKHSSDSFVPYIHKALENNLVYERASSDWSRIIHHNTNFDLFYSISLSVYQRLLRYLRVDISLGTLAFIFAIVVL